MRTRVFSLLLCRLLSHPFLYLIRSGDQILFLGRVTDPRG